MANAIIENDLRELDRRARLFRSSRVSKFFQMPRSLARSSIAQFMALRRDEPMNLAARTFWGDQMRVVLPELVSFSIYRYGFFEEDLSRVLLKCLKPGQIFFDVGGHFGYFSLLASHIVGPAGAVHSFEPTRTTFEILKSNTARCANVTLNNLALHEKSGLLRFHDFGLKFAAYNSLGAGRLEHDVRTQAPSTEYDVKAMSLDEYIGQTNAKPDFIKIDAENAEFDILQGGRQSLARHQPIISTEAGDDEANPGRTRRVVDYLMQLGFLPYLFQSGRLVRHEPKQTYEFANLIFISQDRKGVLDS